MSSIFLQSEWRKLLMANYAVSPELLMPYLPAKTELDLWNGTCYISLVGFMFENTRVKGFRIPGHTHFEEVNLRFYVRYHDNGIWKRGVVFIKEIVPRPTLTFIANLLYNEHYETLPMQHSWIRSTDKLEVSYKWKKDQWNTISAIAACDAQDIKAGSEEEFITEHYWGYTKINDHKTSEYKVQHPRWQVYPVEQYTIDVDFCNVYGADFHFLSEVKPLSVFLAEGSEIAVHEGRRI